MNIQNKVKLLTLFVILPLLAPNMLAQPYEDFHGCMHSKGGHKMQPLTAAQKILMDESAERSDTIDILNYNINLDITDFGGQTIDGNCEISFTPKMDGVNHMKLDLLDFNIDSITLAGNQIAYDYDGNFITINFEDDYNIDDTLSINIYYYGHPTIDEGPNGQSFGGLYFESGVAYNLGIGLNSNPYNYGRGWFPCFDNFVERTTYNMNIVSSQNRKAYCVGTFLEEEDLGDGKILRKFQLDTPITTYLAGVAVSDFVTHDYVHTGVYGDVPVQLVARPGDIDDMITSFEYLDDAIDAFEAWFGPYRFERVGFVLTQRGAMEHATNIAYPTFSGTSGATFANNRLMAHELGHHWWGNITTLSSPANMWIKEGNAEYCAHLFTEYTFGKEAFRDQVKDNHLNNVLTNAHIDDGAFLQLSGIPFEHTYSTHTYRKGASMMHNLRGYLGDTLFQQSMSSMLEVYPFQAINAEQFRDHLIEDSGVDLTSFFDDWIYNPGYSDYELENYSWSASDMGGFDVDIEINQKLRAAPNFHTNVPLTLSFYNGNWESVDREIMVSDEFSDHQVNIPFEPELIIINRDQNLNLSRMQNLQVVTEAGDMSRDYINMTDFEALSVSDSALVNVVHHWSGPDESIYPEVTVSSTHYWSVGGIWPDDFEAKATVRYNASSVNALDYDLAGVTDENLVLLWRPTIYDEWEEYPFYDKLGFGGFIRINPILQGDYTFANGSIPTSTSEIVDDATLSVFPNPANEYVYVEGEIKQPGELMIQLTDLNGKVLFNNTKFYGSDFFSERIDLDNLPTGIYTVQLYGERGDLIKSEKVSVIK